MESKRIALVVGLVLILLSALGISLYLILKKKNDHDKKKKEEEEEERRRREEQGEEKFSPKAFFVNDCGWEGDKGYFDIVQQGVKNDFCRFVGEDKYLSCKLSGDELGDEYFKPSDDLILEKDETPYPYNMCLRYNCSKCVFDTAPGSACVFDIEALRVNQTLVNRSSILQNNLTNISINGKILIEYSNLVNGLTLTMSPEGNFVGFTQDNTIHILAPGMGQCIPGSILYLTDDGKLQVLSPIDESKITLEEMDDALTTVNEEVPWKSNPKKWEDYTSETKAKILHALFINILYKMRGNIASKKRNCDLFLDKRKIIWEIKA